MKMLETYSDFVRSGDEGCKAAFVAAMTKRIQTDGYKMQDLMYEVFCCQCEIERLSSILACIKEEIVKKPEPKSKPKSK